MSNVSDVNPPPHQPLHSSRRAAMNHLREVPLTWQMVEVHEVSAPSTQSVQVADFYQWRHCMAVAKHFQRRVAHVERVLHGTLPVRVLVLQRREYLVQMVHVGVPNVRPQYAVSTTLVETELEVLRTEVQIWLCGRQAK